jgi:hypothetical protein
MFTIPSLPKLFILIAVIAAVWYGFRFLGRIDRLRQEAARAARRQAGQRRSGAAAGGRGDVAQVEDTLKCRVCGAYVPARQPSRCGRSDCPF